MKWKFGLLLIVLLAIGGFFALDLGEHFSLAALQESQAHYQAQADVRPGLVMGLFFSFYVLMAALSLPGAAIMTLAGGALFGIVAGTAVASFASAIGASLAFLIARFVLHDTVQQRFGRRLATINQGVRREGTLYLFTLRLVPAFPFFLINILMALTPIRTFTFYWVSQVGMLPATVLYVNAGTRLSELDRPGDILSPVILGSFALLGLFPLLAKRTVVLLERRRMRIESRRSR